MLLPQVPPHIVCGAGTWAQQGEGHLLQEVAAGVLAKKYYPCKGLRCIHTEHMVRRFILTAGIPSDWLSMHTASSAFKAEGSLCAGHATKALLGAEQHRQLEQTSQRSI